MTSFFFNSAHADRDSPVKTIGHLAFALSSIHPVVKNAVAVALKNRPDLISENLVTQFQELIRHPLSLLPSEAPSVVIIIDALDEADDSLVPSLEKWSKKERMYDTFLKVLAEECALISPRVRMLVTARDEPRSVSLLEGKSHVEVHRLHQYGVVYKDIWLFAKSSFSIIASRKGVPAWPSEEQLVVFAQKSAGLFIWARLALDWIDDADDPKEDLNELLSLKPPPDAADHINDMYAMIFQRLPWSRSSFAQRYARIVGAILTSKMTFSLPCLASLLGESVDDLSRTVSRLRPVMFGTIDHEEALIFTHQSVRDYLTVYAPKRKGEEHFAINFDNAHTLLAKCCLRVLSERISDKWVEICTSDRTLKNDTLPINLVDDPTIYAIDWWHVHIASAKELGAQTEELLKAPSFASKWQASIVIKTMKAGRGKEARTILQAQHDSGFLSTSSADSRAKLPIVAAEFEPLPVMLLGETLVRCVRSANAIMIRDVPRTIWAAAQWIAQTLLVNPQSEDLKQKLDQVKDKLHFSGKFKTNSEGYSQFTLLQLAPEELDELRHHENGEIDERIPVRDEKETLVDELTSDWTNPAWFVMGGPLGVEKWHLDGSRSVSDPIYIDPENGEPEDGALEESRKVRDWIVRMLDLV
ncbi:hypothetical protein DL93DRAFT_1867123 [Clavulina sp. PMI_390]|nr:hypothetical protein DL93DRAFT_1867123 [Clavulina sp. PMI_390]